MTSPIAAPPETDPKNSFTGKAAQAVASYCLLPDPRHHDPLNQVKHWLYSWQQPRNFLSTNGCTQQEIREQAAKFHTAVPLANSPVYAEITKHARVLMARGIAECQVRDFHDTVDEPNRYVGYPRATDGICEVKLLRIERR